MRQAGEIKKRLLQIRDFNHMPYATICADSRCSRFELTAALRLEASEDTLRKLDAYLDAPQLHHRRKNTELLYQIENMDKELYRVYGGKSRHLLTVQDWSIDQQKRHADAMDYRLRRLLGRVCELLGRKVTMPDGMRYWKWKEQLIKRGKITPLELEDGNANRLLREDPMGKSRFL